mmetsp:Transcript_2949/g.9145  ORF Transcript_2949/g.9145 Transcript_2949/m.9145 type:complete len:246 (+) Transcript_2949:812-1549(+)
MDGRGPQQPALPASVRERNERDCGRGHGRLLHARRCVADRAWRCRGHHGDLRPHRTLYVHTLLALQRPRDCALRGEPCPRRHHRGAPQLAHRRRLPARRGPRVRLPPLLLRRRQVQESAPRHSRGGERRPLLLLRLTAARGHPVLQRRPGLQPPPQHEGPAHHGHAGEGGGLGVLRLSTPVRVHARRSRFFGGERIRGGSGDAALVPARVVAHLRVHVCRSNVAGMPPTCAMQGPWLFKCADQVF